MIERATGAVRQLTRNLGPYPPRWSPDGHYLAYIKVSSYTLARAFPAPGNVYVVEVDTGTEHQLTDYPGSAIESLAWSPSGQWIAYSLSLGYHNEIWATDLNGQTRFPLAGPAAAHAPVVWLP